MVTRLSILYVGPLNYGSTCLQRMQALERLGYEVSGIDMQSKYDLSFIGKVFRKLKIPLDFNRGNKKIIEHLKAKKYDLLWIDKGLQIFPATIKKAKLLRPGIQIVSYSPDDMLNPDNQSKFYLKGVRLFDYHVTTKSFNVSELKEIGAKKVIFSEKAFDPFTHKKIQLLKEDLEKYKCDVGFIGQFEDERFRSMLYLAENGIRVTVRGPNWEKYTDIHENLDVRPGFFMGETYSKIINATAINLCFLRKANRDLQTARSIEIPACGGFMLAERTTEHMKLFEDGKEAVFFSDDQELLRQVNYYLNNPSLRQSIADAGMRRCNNSGYSTDERLKEILNMIASKKHEYAIQTNHSEDFVPDREICKDQDRSFKRI